MRRVRGSKINRKQARTMSKFLTTPGVVAEVERIVRNARKFITFITPFVDPSANFIERLQEAERRRVRATLVIGKRDLKPEEEEKLSGLKNLRILFYPTLHAKCYANEESLVITSLNLLEYSERSNREMGVLVEHAHDPSTFEEAQNEVRSIVEASRPYEEVFNGRFQNWINTLEEPRIVDVGYCIRCHHEIHRDPTRPLCSRCYGKYAQWKDPYYTECFCHDCGRKYGTSFAKPLCPECYRALAS